jgi:prepilin peptidase CpaA
MSLVMLAGAALVGVASLVAGIMDLAVMRIKNELILLLLFGYLVIAPFSDLAFVDIVWSLAAGIGILLCMFICFHFGWVGGGDAKLLAVLSVWLGVHNVLHFVLLTTILGGGLTIVLLFLRQIPLHPLLFTKEWIVRLHSPKTGIPYGVAISASALIMLPHTAWL